MNKAHTTKRYYPIPVSGMNGFLFSVLFGFFIALFLWYFKPYNLNQYGKLEIIFFGVISFAVFFVAHTLLPLLKPEIYLEKNWTIYSQILFYIILSLAIATFNGLYVNYLYDLDFSWSNYALIIVQTFAVGIIPITLYVLLSHNWMYRRIIEQSDALNKTLGHDTKVEVHQYTVQSDIKDESFPIDDTTFLFAKSSGNYIEVFSSNRLVKVYRMSLADLEKQLIESTCMLRCHRSYFVNTKHIVKVTGNAQGLKLWLTDEENYIPVSRKYLGKVKSVLANN